MTHRNFWKLGLVGSPSAHPRSVATLYARLAVGSAFLSAVAARLGFWDARPEPFADFVRYTGEVLAFMPQVTIPYLAVGATVAETLLGFLLVLGIAPRWSGLASAALLATFAVSMALSFGVKAPLDASVFSASAAALLLAEGATEFGREEHGKGAEAADRSPGSTTAPSSR